MSNSIEKFNVWCKKLEQSTGISYPLVFGNSVEQIKQNWGKSNADFDLNVNLVLIALNTHNHHDLLIEFTETIFLEVEQGSDFKLQLRMLVNAGVASDMLGRSGAAAAMYEKAENIARKNIQNFDVETNRIAGSLFYNKAKLLLEKDKPTTITLLLEAIEFFKKGEYKGGIARCMNMQAYLMPIEENEERIKLYLKAAELFEEENDINSQAMAFANVGMRLVENNEFEHGLKYIQKALELNFQNSNPFYIGCTYLMLSEAYLINSNFTQAKSFVELADIEFSKAKVFAYEKKIAALREQINSHLLTSAKN